MTALSESTVAVIAAGYADGYPRHARTGTPVFVNGQPVELIGRVSMDMVAVDISNIVAKRGDPVVLWGDGLAVERVADYADTIAYELLCSISRRVPVLVRRDCNEPENAPA